MKPYFEGVLSPEARTKPQPGELVAVPSRAEVVMEAETPKAPAELPERTSKRFAQVHGALLQRIPALPALDLNTLRELDLLAAPEVGLAAYPVKKGGALSASKDDLATKRDLQMERQEVKKLLADLAGKIRDKNGEQPDGFIRGLAQESSELSGMPFRLGKACQLSASEAKQLASSALGIRVALHNTTAGPRGTPYDSPYDPLSTFWGELGKRLSRESAAGKAKDDLPISLLPGLMQILATERSELRVELIGKYRSSKEPQVTAALARLAIYDPEPEVRTKAVHALADRPANEYSELLLEAFRYPWAPVAERAADAIVVLKRIDLLPQLIDLLDEPDPCAPFEQDVQGKKVPVVRELVKLNHHRNCLLCHGLGQVEGNPARALPQGLVPSPAEDLPPSSGTVYYAGMPGDIVVRADVTYLRQDFSMLLPVENAAPWPPIQRFDFLVRARVVTEEERKAFEQRQLAAGPLQVSPQHAAVQWALRRLTGLDAGPTAAAWRQAVPSATPARQAPAGRPDCRK